MKYRLLGYREEKGRIILVIEKKVIGIFAVNLECIDSDKTYAISDENLLPTFQKAWFYYPSFEKIGPVSKLQKFCESCMRKIEHEKK